MLGVMDTVFEILLAAILVGGSAHTVASIYRERLEHRRWREAVKRLRFGESNA
jgi:hypothetical protein